MTQIRGIRMLNRRGFLKLLGGCQPGALGLGATAPSAEWGRLC